MRKIVLLVALVAAWGWIVIPGFFAGGAMNAGAPPLTTGQAIYADLLSWYDFENSTLDGMALNDLSGTGTYSAGLVGQQITKTSLVQDTSFVGLSDLNSGGAGLSFGGWFYISGTADEDVIALRSGSSSSQAGHYIAIRSSGTALHYVAQNTVPLGNTITSSVATAVGNRYFAVGTFDASTSEMKLYLGETEVASGTMSGTSQTPTQCAFGRVSPASYANLRNDSSFVVDRVLTPEEISWLYNSGAGRALSDLGDDLAGDPRAVWTWFNDPRAIQLGSGNIVVGGQTNDGAIAVFEAASPYTSWTRTNLKTVTADDHNNPALLRRDSDNKILAMYTPHNNAGYFGRVSSSADSAASFASETNHDSTIGGSNYSYANLFQLTGMTNDPVMALFRSGTNPSWTMHYATSTDQGATFGAQTALLSAGRPYLKAVQSSTTRIHFAVTDGHPAEVTTNSIRHFYYDNGSWYDSSGASIGSPPFDTTTDLTTVYDGTTNRAWVWDIQVDGSGNPVIVFSVFPSTTDHRYYYAKWNGSSWDVNEICAAGTYLYSGQPYYSGGVAIDPDDVNVVYASRESGGLWNLWRYTTADGGSTFSAEQLTSGRGKRFRPFVVPGANRLLYLQGEYTDYLNFYTVIRSMDISP